MSHDHTYRELVKRSLPDGSDEWLQSSFNDAANNNRTFIKREYGNGTVEWFDTSGHTPTADDLLDPKEAAALQLGITSRLLPFDKWFQSTAGKLMTCLTHIETEVCDAAENDLERLLTEWQEANELSRWQHWSNICHFVDNIFLKESPNRNWMVLGAAMGDEVIRLKLCNPDQDVSVLLEGDGSNQQIEDMLSVLRNNTTILLKPRPGVVRHLLAHKLDPRGGEHDFASETLASWENVQPVNSDNAGDTVVEQPATHSQSSASNRDDWCQVNPPTDSWYGPIEGQIKQVAEALSMNARTFKKACRDDIYWATKVHKTKYRIWFQDDHALQEADDALKKILSESA
jgi:hypothetical protein